MSTSAAPVATRQQLETALIEKCWKDPEFKQRVVGDPKGMLERHTGQQLPPHIKIFIHEEDANTLHFSIPPAPGNLAELSDEDLERVAGGTDVVLTFAAIVTIAATAAGTALTVNGIVDMAGGNAW